MLSSYDLLGISKRVLELTPLKIKQINIAISGFSRSGKSVFISSFIDQILHNKNLFTHTKSKTFNATLNAPSMFMKRFDYYHYEKILKVDQNWCKGTDNISIATLKIQTKGLIPFIGDDEFYINLIDYPGEWLLDLILLDKSYASWSDMTIKRLENINDEKAKEYLRILQKINTKDTSISLETMLHAKYLSLIKHLKKNNYSFITPGRFLVPADMKDDPILLFAPIKMSDSKLFKTFALRYDTYVNEIVKKIHLDYFRGFDRQIVLIDVIKALENSYECYTDMKLALKNMFGTYFHKKGNFLSKILNPSIEKVAFVATKADLIPKNSHENFKSLLKDISEDLYIKLLEADVKTYFHVISSLRCTQNVSKIKNATNIECLRGISKDGKMVELYPGLLPLRFPNEEDWEEEELLFEEFLPPKKIYAEDESFPHINLDRLIWDMIGDLL